MAAIVHVEDQLYSGLNYRSMWLFFFEGVLGVKEFICDVLLSGLIFDLQIQGGCSRTCLNYHSM